MRGVPYNIRLNNFHSHLHSIVQLNRFYTFWNLYIFYIIHFVIICNGLIHSGLIYNYGIIYNVGHRYYLYSCFSYFDYDNAILFVSVKEYKLLQYIHSLNHNLLSIIMRQLPGQATATNVFLFIFSNKWENVNLSISEQD